MRICYNIVANMKGVMIMQDEARWEMIYNKINGFIEPDVCPWVRDESSMEGALGPLARQVYEAPPVREDGGEPGYRPGF